MWNRTDAWIRSTGHKLDLVDDKKTLATYMTWCEATFGEGDLFVTLNCPTIRNLSAFISTKLLSIEKRVRKVQPDFNLYRIAVLVRKPQYHAHLILKGTDFSNSIYSSFEDLVDKQFRKALWNKRDVEVTKLDNIYAVTRYGLLMQDCCQIDTQSLFLPPTHNTH